MDNSFYKTSGKLHYYGRTCNLYVDRQIGPYYRALLPKYLNIKPPKAHSHISIVRKFEEPPFKDKYWGKYEGEVIEVSYTLPIYTDGIYCWLDAWSNRIKQIREELGLCAYLKDGRYHITIGNTKGQN